MRPCDAWIFAADSCLRRMSPYLTPKDIFQAACDELGRYFERDGLRYVRSRPRLEQQRGDLVLVMSLWSSRSNMAGQHVALEVVSTVRARRLARWSKQTGEGRPAHNFSVDTKNPTPGTYDNYFDVWGVTPASFVVLAEKIRDVCWTPMACIEADGSIPETL